MVSRKEFIKGVAAAGTATWLAPRFNILKAAEEQAHEVTQLTTGPKQHWMGYYDKWQVDPSGQWAVGNQVDLLFRSPTHRDKLGIGLIDLKNGNRWKQIGASTSWGWQQGCMLQWIPGSKDEVIWNDHDESGNFISRVYNVQSGVSRTLPKAVYTLSPDGSFALCVDMDRLQFFRPGYGYPTREPKQYRKAPTDQGIYKMDLKTGNTELVLSYAQIAVFTGYPVDLSNYYHWFNHLLVNPSATRFIFLNRSRPVGPVDEMNAWYERNTEIRFSGSTSGRYLTRALTANLDGSDVYALNDSGRFSHFIWKGDDVITAWSDTDDGAGLAFYEFADKTKSYEAIDREKMPGNGHNTYVPNTNYEWILNDTYPSRKDRKQTLYLYHVPTRRKVVLGRFLEPEIFTGEWRCDLHPRCDQQGKRVFFDSTHIGGKRQMYSIDIGSIVGM